LQGVVRFHQTAEQLLRIFFGHGSSAGFAGNGSYRDFQNENGRMFHSGFAMRFAQILAPVAIGVVIEQV